MKHQNMDIIARCRGLPGEEVQGGPEKMGWAGLGGEAMRLGWQGGGFSEKEEGVGVGQAAQESGGWRDELERVSTGEQGQGGRDRGLL